MPWAWRNAFTFYRESPHWKRDFLWGGVFLLLCPPLGWPLALGYRREVARRLLAGESPVLPGWKDWPRFLADGFRAAGVICVYYTPFLVAFWSLGADSLRDHAREILLFSLLVPIFPPVGIALMPPAMSFLAPWVHVPWSAKMVLGALFWPTTFMMPAAFLQVSLTGRFRSAFRIARMVALVRAVPGPYLKAWGISLAATAIAGLTGPLVTAGIVWSYVVIVYAFNAALSRWDEARSTFASSRRFPE